MVLAIIGRIGIAGGSGYARRIRRQRGSRAIVGRRPHDSVQHGDRSGARAGMVAVDKTIEYFHGRPYGRRGTRDVGTRAAQSWGRSSKSDADAKFDKEVILRTPPISDPQVTWGVFEMVVPDGCGRARSEQNSTSSSVAVGGGVEYMSLKARYADTRDYARQDFIGSCTNSRIELRAAAAVVEESAHRQEHQACPGRAGSGLVKTQAEKEGLDKIFKAAGFEWREPRLAPCVWE